MTYLDKDARLESALATTKTREAVTCGCRVRYVKEHPDTEVQTVQDATHVQVISVCPFHRKWLAALVRDARKPAPLDRGQLPLVGPVYQPARVTGGATSLTHPEAQPRQQGGHAHMVGPLHQPVAPAGILDAEVAAAPAVTISNPRMMHRGHSIEDLIGFNPFKSEG